MLAIGTIAPDFSLKDQNGRLHSLHDYLGKTVILYFYPRDNTPGCTIEACSFRDYSPVFAEQGVVILGISKDNVSSHAKFADRFALEFPLLSDPEKIVQTAYQALGEKKFLGKTYLGTLRITYVIDKGGVIKKVYDKVNPLSHTREILAELS